MLARSNCDAPRSSGYVSRPNPPSHIYAVDREACTRSASGRREQGASILFAGCWTRGFMSVEAPTAPSLPQIRSLAWRAASTHGMRPKGQRRSRPCNCSPRGQPGAPGRKPLKETSFLACKPIWSS